MVVARLDNTCDEVVERQIIVQQVLEFSIEKYSGYRRCHTTTLIQFCWRVPTASAIVLVAFRRKELSMCQQVTASADLEMQQRVVCEQMVRYSKSYMRVPTGVVKADKRSDPKIKPCGTPPSYSEFGIDIWLPRRTVCSQLNKTEAIREQPYPVRTVSM